MEDSDEIRERVTKVMRQISRDLRQRSTSAEALLWEYLRDRRLDGIKFRRQNPVLKTTYVVDFYCRESLLAVELDGAVHDIIENQLADIQRQQTIAAQGIEIIRFRNQQVFDDLNGVLVVILTTHLNRTTAQDADNSSTDSG